MKIAFINRLVPSWIVFIIDLCICFCSILLSFLLRFNFQIPADYSGRLLPVIVVILTIRALSFFIGRTHVNIIRYTSISDLLKLIFVTLVSSILILACNIIYSVVTGNSYYVPLSILIIEFLTTAYTLAFFRMMVKMFFVELKSNTSNKDNTIILGTEELAISVKRALDLDSTTNFKIVAFIDNNKDIHKRKLDGIDIFSYKKLDFIAKKYQAKSIVFAKPEISNQLKNLLVEKSLNLGLKVLQVQDIKSWFKGGFDVKQIRNIRIEDLLEREPIMLDFTLIRKEIGNKTIMVTGAGGSIGSEIVRQIADFKPLKIILFDQAETPLHDIEVELDSKKIDCKIEIILGDLTNAEKLKHIFETHKIDIIYHAAAYKHVPMMERHPAEAIRNNVFGTKIIADMAIKHKVSSFVMISTDKAVNPTNVMGASKRIAEIYTQSLNEFGVTNFITTRFGNVLGSSGSVIPMFKRQIENGGPITVTDPEVTRFFMTIPEACQLVLEASVIGKGGEIFIFDMGKSVKISDLAKNMIKLAGLIPGKDIDIKYVGLRPGEKLYEELLATEENTMPTHHSKIMIAKVKCYHFEDVSLQINSLISLSNTGNIMQIVGKMKDIVPEYKSHNSIFKSLDNDRKYKQQLQYK